MLIDKISIAAKEMTSKDETREALNYLLITNDTTVATDGKVLIEIGNPKQSIDEYPATDLKNIDTPVLLHSDTIDKVEKNIPKKPTLPILKNALIGKRDKDNEICIYTTDLQSPQTITQKIDDVTYPNYKQVYPAGKPVCEVTLAVDNLKKLVTVMEKIKKHNTVKLSFYGENNPVRFESNVDDRTIQCLIMPGKQE